MIPSIRYLFSKDKKFVQSLRNLLGFTPGNPSVYHLAFRHRSTATEHSNGAKISNERLEYLGDAVLGAIIADMLFKKFPFREEGFLTEMRSKIVNREHLNKLALKLGIDHFMVNSIDPAAKNKSAYGDAFEALIGAIYIDKGYNVAQRFVLKRIVRNHIDIEEIEAQDKNFKSKLINWSQRERKVVEFELIEEVENAGKKLLRVKVLIDGIEKARGEDFSKKRAEQIAAEKVCKELGLE